MKVSGVWELRSEVTVYFCCWKFAVNISNDPLDNMERDCNIVNYITGWCLKLHADFQLQIIYDTIVSLIFNVVLLLNRVSWLLLVLYQR